MSWKSEVIADSTGKWNSNGLRFATDSEAKDYVKDLRGRWTSVRETRVVEVDEPVTHQWVTLLGRAVNLDDPSISDQPDARVQGAYPKYDS